MVGVAGKSKGCNTCRKRKKGCDLARPSCGQCLKSGNVCGGYQKDLTFIHHKIPDKDRQPSTVPKASLRKGSVASSDRSYSPSCSDLVSWPPVSPNHDWEVSSEPGQQQSWPSPSLQLLSSSLTLTALTTLHTSLFNSVFMPRISFATQPSLMSFRHSTNWTHFIPELVNNDLSLQLAFLALSSSRIGHDSHDENLITSSQSLYGKALREMQRALLDPKRRHADEVILACSTLSLYEIFETQALAAVQLGATPHGWLSHAAGVGRLLEARGPEGFATGKGHAIFLHVRILIAIRYSTARKACFLAKPEWLTSPWKNHPKNMLHKMIDVMVFLPVVVETYDRLQADTSFDFGETRRERQSLLAKCVALDKQLQNWYTALCAEVNGRPLWHTFPSDDASYPFSHLFRFDESIIAYTILLYWTCAMMIQSTMCQLQRQLGQGAAQLPDMDNLPDHINPRIYAVNIAQSLPYMLHPDMGSLGPNLALFPLGMAFAFFAATTRTPRNPDMDAMESSGSTIDGLDEVNDPLADDSAIDVDYCQWFAKVFTDLDSRNMPGEAFLFRLMKAVGIASAFTGVHPVIASAASTND
ncbi:hypothetical protein EPUS_01257 [Endocarpon pusillum Z07020]|uniref:Zn(2)-C6 fungal-type domain-containing protein n=1 Tax=Endocarpon pusillum (strain Z07020 / HMAS-L-300199) TaxID=1263415 RepID=U1GV16_ENDPU|nr:uncharacterized protein EPUS_01257 [Endocarpon pusillum Z07020]ERF75891.1 hypothetical protein EPUS_01257 [Endocarpon pusillum Z07020]